MNDNNFDRYLSYWLKTNYLIQINNSTYQINRNFQQKISLFTNPFEQYARAYLLIYEQENSSLEKNLSTLTKSYHKNLLAKLDSKNIISVLASSSNVINNALRILNLKNNSNEISQFHQILKKLFQPMSTKLISKL